MSKVTNLKFNKLLRFNHPSSNSIRHYSQNAYNFLFQIYHIILCNINLCWFYLTPNKTLNHKEIPIIINNRNRLTFLQQLIDSLIIRGYNNITILDNDSTYPPLLEYYKTKPCNIIFLNKNLGYDALDKIPLFKQIRKNYFVYTDPDIIPINECPADFLNFFLNTLKKYPTVQKVGFSLKIDDLPDHFDTKKHVIDWEKKFYTNLISDKYYLAPIDTTFALHRPFSTLSTKGRLKMFRTSHPYVARHMPWYIDSANLSEEEKFYVEHVQIGTHWSKGLELKESSFKKLVHFLTGWKKTKPLSDYRNKV